MSSFFYGRLLTTPAIKIIEGIFSVLYKSMTAIKFICFTAFQRQQGNGTRLLTGFLLYAIQRYTPCAFALMFRAYI